MAASLALLAVPAQAAPFGYPEFLGASTVTLDPGEAVNYDPVPTSPRGDTIVEVRLAGGLPAGLSFSPSTRTVSGTADPGTSGRYDVSFVAEDDNGRASDPFRVSFFVTGPPSLAGATTATFVEGAAGSYDPLLHNGFLADAAVALSGGPLPSGLTMDPGTGAITGVPAYGTVGTYEVTLVASNSAGSSAALDVSIAVEHAPAPASFVLQSTSTVLSGQPFTVSGDGLVPGSTVVIELRSTPVTLGTVAADATGAFSLLVSGLPEGVPTGGHNLVATATTPGGGITVASLAVTVPALLASTGAEAVWPLGAAVLLLAAGGALMVLHRRRPAV